MKKLEVVYIDIFFYIVFPYAMRYLKVCGLIK